MIGLVCLSVLAFLALPATGWMRARRHKLLLALLVLVILAYQRYGFRMYVAYRDYYHEPMPCSEDTICHKYPARTEEEKQKWEQVLQPPSPTTEKPFL
ncbi:hypothetical protein P171DRAFT_437711, partial [Karstenula rhodostoma CBS 690.94]